MSKETSILFCGDPHGDFGFIIDAAREARPAAAVIVGDFYARKSLPAEGETADTALAAVRAEGVRVLYIHGNHESDRPEIWKASIESLPAEDGLHARFEAVGSVSLGGLGGVFRQKVWFPNDGTEPRFLTRESKLACIPKNERFRNGLPVKDRTTIFPEDLDALRERSRGLPSAGRILVTHEAPETHEFGAACLSALARDCGAGLLVHGHHHFSYRATLPCGTKVRGLAGREAWLARFGADGRLIEDAGLWAAERCPPRPDTAGNERGESDATA